MATSQGFQQLMLAINHPAFRTVGGVVFCKGTADEQNDK